MSNITDLTERNYTHQQSIVINARYALTQNEIDIVLVLLTAIHKDDKDFKDYQFTIADLVAKTGRKWNSKQLKATVKGLMSKPLELPKEGKGWTIVNWFSFFEYDDSGLITCRFDKRLKPYLVDIQGRMILGDVRHLLPMKSSYSKRVYLLLKEYSKFGVRKFEVEELMEILKVPKSFKVYSEFKKKVLQRAEQDINKFTDLKVSFDEKKLGRKVKSITFFIKKNDEDLKTFIGYIRELYTNQALYEGKDGRMLKCSDKGLLYYVDDVMEWLDEKTAQKAWEWLHENREKLYCFQADLFNQPKLF
jgi:plasmid replication initiation protein